MIQLASSPGPIGIFDSGYGGLTILKAIKKLLPQYDYLYLGDNARMPYGQRSFDEVYQFTRQAVVKLFEEGCHLVILGCNTASAKALRSIQQNDLSLLDANRRVLGVIRPTAEIIGKLSKSRHIGLLATEGTVRSNSYQLEIQKFYPDIKLSGLSCPFWVPLVEYGEANSPGADYFVQQRLDMLMAMDNKIDTIILGCTHYPLLMPKIKQYIPAHIKVISQGEYVATSLKDYLKRHVDMAEKCTNGGTTRFLTTDLASRFQQSAQVFLNEEIKVQHIDLG